MIIAVSTVAFNRVEVQEIINLASENKLYIEFSSGLPYSQELKAIYLNAPIKKILHNYFPPPSDPFVLNLASSNEEIRKKSVDHCIQGLGLAAESDAPFFSAHAGFCIDPIPEELGKPMNLNKRFNRSTSWGYFKKSIFEILKSIENSDIEFLIENNVIIKENLTHSENPFLCCDPDELRKLFAEINHHKLGLLLDTGHLKVSSNTLKFHLDTSIEPLKQFIRCIHHSSNDGLFDSNMPITTDYWFKDQMPDFKECLHVLEVKNLSIEVIKKQLHLLEHFGNA